MEIGNVWESLPGKTEEETAEESLTDASAEDTEEANAGRPEQNAGTV